MIPLLQSKDDIGIKVCGLRTEEDVDIAVGAGANAIGFMFVRESPRFIERHVADQLALQLPEAVGWGRVV